MKEKKLLSVNQIFHLEISKFMQRVALKSIPKPFQQIFECQIRSTHMNTRSSSFIFQGYSGSTKCKQAIRIQGPVIWNRIPEKVKMNSLSQGTSSTRWRNGVQRDLLPMTSFSASIKEYVLDKIDFI